MAIPATMQWEIRTSGSNENGAGFDPAIGVTDYSQQDGPQLDRTDLATPGAGSTTLTSATGGFTAAMVGNVIYIRGGTNFTVGAYEVVAFTDANTVTLDRTATPSAAGSGGLGKLGGAGATIQHIQGRAVAGNDFWFKYSATPFSFAANHELLDGVATDWTRYIGYETTRGDIDAGTASNFPVLKATANTVDIFRNTVGTNGCILIKNLEFDGDRGTRTEARGIYISVGPFRILNCRLKNCQRAGAALQADGEMIGCLVTNCGESASFSEFGAVHCLGGTPLVRGCDIYSNNTNGIYISSGNAVIDRCKIYKNTASGRHGMRVAASCKVLNCTIHGNGQHGIWFSGTGIRGCLVADTLITGHSGKGLEQETPLLDQILLLHCAGYGNAGGNYDSADFPSAVGFQSLTSDPYVNAAGNDYRIAPGATGGDLVMDRGSLGAFPDGAVGRLDIGAIEMGTGAGSASGTVVMAFAG